jgi:hypothetical protein
MTTPAAHPGTGWTASGAPAAAPRAAVAGDRRGGGGAGWNATYLFRLGFERWISARPGYDGWVLLGVVGLYLLAFAACACRKACGASPASARCSA